MIYRIDEDVVEKSPLNIAELLIILLVKTESDIDSLIQEMVQKQILVRKGENNSLLITQRWNDIATNILLDSDPDKPPEDKVQEIATKLMAVFPTGKKDGTNQYWRGNMRETSTRLKKFFKLYGNTFTPDEIVDAAKRYVEGFNGQYRFMRVLKYFIWKDEKRLMEDGTFKVIEVSELANYLENAEQEEDLKDDWTSTLK